MTRITEDKTREEITKTLVAIVCDVCNTRYEMPDDVFEIQEFECIRRTGGYGSVFGDEDTIECDICQHCLKKLIGEYFRYVKID